MECGVDWCYKSADTISGFGSRSVYDEFTLLQERSLDRHGSRRNLQFTADVEITLCPYHVVRLCHTLEHKQVTC